jgi:alanyl-tRNA synthetase
MKSHDIRRMFLDYYKKHGHSEQPSSSLIPENDATLLFANAGMNQFKNLFLGLEQRPYKRAVTSQKCVRAGGKHNDLENVGHTARHHTFFEMLGNFSFGDYFKKDAIHFAWELLTKEVGIPKEKLYVSVFTDDDEAAEIWHKQEGVARDRIFRFGEKDNFWRMGDTGPCGPCSEIFYDHGPEADSTGKATMENGGDRYVEIWNNVFMQFNESPSGRTPLPKPSVDTGAGLERWASVLQGKPNNYDTDLFQPIIQKASAISGKEYVSEPKRLSANKELSLQVAAMRVVADHSRATAFLIADGVLPSNEGRGYVLRRIMRRAIRYGRNLSDDASLFPQTVAVVIEQMGKIYPELTTRKPVIMQNVQDEVSRFLQTLDQGTDILNDNLSRLSSRGLKVVDGETVFKLYDTYGFPADLTRIMAEEKGFAVDETGFEKQMDAAREKAKASWKGKALDTDAAHLVQFAQKAKDAVGPTKFSGYTTTHATGNVALLSDGYKIVDSLKSGDSGVIAFDSTCFYAESGGQVGDHGVIQNVAGARAEVLDCTKQNEVHLHHIRVISGTLKKGDAVEQQVLDSKRRSTAANHSATHLLHAALRKTLGPHVTQAGSLVDSERLRFDYTHNRPLSLDEINVIETLVNEEIAKGYDVDQAEMEHKKAIEAGALALFGEKYGDRVRVIRMGDFSTELCGGTHVSNTAKIRVFKLVSDSGVSSGIRRIEALTGDRAVQYLLKNTRENLHARSAAGYSESWSAYLSDEPLAEPGQPHAKGAVARVTVADWIEHNKSLLKQLEREVKAAKGSKVDLDVLVGSAKSFQANGSAGKIVTAYVEIDDRQMLSEISDKIKDRIQSGVVVLVGNGDGSYPIVVTVSKDLTAKLSAGKLLGEIAKEMGGKGGGRPDFAQGAGADLSKLEQALHKAQQLVGVVAH